MTQRVLGPTGGRRRKRLALLLPFIAIAALILAIGASAGPISNAAGFQGDDGNLVDDAAATGIDWNSFATLTWTGTAPYREAHKSLDGWDFDGIEDAAELTTDTAFAGGVKQDANCAALVGNKAPNKDDLERAYFANAKVDGDVYLALAWVRIPQNTTNASAHVGFEFNQSDTGCGGTSPLVQRTAGDLLFVYDFEGSSTDAPHITVREWITEPAGKGNCEISQNSTPCWGTAVDITDTGDAEARVNTNPGPGASPILDGLAPNGAENLGTNEFGEAIVNLSDAIDAIGGNACIAFGNAYAVSRSSGNSGTAQMKDLAGPGDVDIKTCGGIIINKETDPAGDTETTFGFTTGGGLMTDEDPPSDTFTLKDGESEDFGDEVQSGTYTVTEDDPSPLYALDSIECEIDGEGGSDYTVTLADLEVEIELAGEDTVECTFTNKLQEGALLIQKNSTKSGSAVLNDGAVFSYNGSSVTDNGTGDEDTDVGEVCVSGLTPGDYTVNETTAPDGYGDAPASEADQEVSVVGGTDCGDNLPGAGATATFSNDPLADIQVRFRDGGSGETALESPLSCVVDPLDTSMGTPSTADTTDWDDTLTIEDIAIDGIVEFTCTIEIDP